MDVPIEGLSWLFPFDTVWHFSIVYLVMGVIASAGYCLDPRSLGYSELFEKGDLELVLQCNRRFNEKCFSKWSLLWSKCLYCHIAAFVLKRN